MAEWAYVENNEIVELHDLLPISWRNISGLRNAADNIEFLNSVGWYRVVKDHQSFDDTQYKIAGYNHIFNNNIVTETLNIISTEVASFESLKRTFMYELRIKRDGLLTNSDVTQLADQQAKLSEELKYKWEKYRQDLRDLPQQYMNSEIVSLSDVVWPDLNNYTYSQVPNADPAEPDISNIE
jgi:hypothetical protein